MFAHLSLLLERCDVPSHFAYESALTRPSVAIVVACMSAVILVPLVIVSSFSSSCAARACSECMGKSL